MVPVRLPEKLLRDIDAWGGVYRNEHELEGMNHSTAIRCLLLLGLEAVKLRIIGPMIRLPSRGATLPLLRFFYRRPTVEWLAEGTANRRSGTPFGLTVLGTARKPDEPHRHHDDCQAAPLSITARSGDLGCRSSSTSHRRSNAATRARSSQISVRCFSRSSFST